jgi:hypothetical protein
MQKDGGLVSRAVREALGTLVSPQLSEQIVARSLAVSGLAQVPEGGAELAPFCHALRSEIEVTVGGDAAELVSSQLSPIVAYAGAQLAAAAARAPATAQFPSERPTGVMPAQAAAKLRREALARTARTKLSAEEAAQLARIADQQGHTARPQADESNPLIGSMPRVLAASAEPRSLADLERYLARTARVVEIIDLVALLDALDEPNLHTPIVLIDCRRPTVNVASVAAIGEDLPPGTAIVLWGASETTWRELDRDRVPACRWVRCSQEATPEDVGSLCSALLG